MHWPHTSLQDTCFIFLVLDSTQSFLAGTFVHPRHTKMVPATTITSPCGIPDWYRAGWSWGPSFYSGQEFGCQRLNVVQTGVKSRVSERLGCLYNSVFTTLLLLQVLSGISKHAFCFYGKMYEILKHPFPESFLNGWGNMDDSQSILKYWCWLTWL